MFYFPRLALLLIQRTVRREEEFVGERPTIQKGKPLGFPEQAFLKQF